MKIIHDLSKCIGCGTCVSLCPRYFEMGEDQKAHLKGSPKKEETKEELEINEASCAKEGAESCPVQAIEVK